MFKRNGNRFNRSACAALQLLVLAAAMTVTTESGVIHAVTKGGKYDGPALANLKREVGALLERKVCQEGKVGIVIQDLETGELLFDRQADTPLMPASNQKVLTTIGALGILTPQFVFTTDVHYSGTLKDGRVSGDLFLTGGGDPFLIKESLWKIAERVYAMGIRTVTGNIVVDGHYFDEIGNPDEDWKRISMPLWYNAPTGGAAYNFNAISVIAAPGSKPGDRAKISIDPPLDYFDIQSTATTGSPKSKVTLILGLKESGDKCVVTVSGKIPLGVKPQTYYRHLKSSQEYAGHSFHYYLQQVGVLVEGSVAKGKKPDKVSRVFENKSLPLSELLRNANKFSNNFMMEQITKTIAAESCSCSGSTKYGAATMKDFFANELKVDTTGMVISDGSGLSRLNKVTARQMCAVIRWTLNQSTFGPEFLTCLPIAGVDGTMKRRLAKHPDRRLVRAKTGLINNVVCLSGVVDGRQGKGLVFSILINQNKGRHGESKKVEDDILAAMLTFWNRQNGDHAAPR